MPFPYEVMLAICELVYWSADGRRLLLPISQVNTSIREVALEVLWNELPSAEPLLHLLPEDVIERHLERDGKWSYSYIGTPLPSDLEQFYTRAPRIRAIISHEHSLRYDAVDAFKNILDYHSSISNAPFLLHLAHLQLSNNSDPLLEFIPSLIHMGLETLVLPYRSSLSSSIISRVLQILPPLRNIVYVEFGEEAHDFVHHIHLMPSLRSLTIPLLEPAVMQAVFSHPHLLDLTVVVYMEVHVLDADMSFHHAFRSFSIIFTRSFLFGGVDEETLNTAITILRALRVPCQQLSVTSSLHVGGDVLGELIEALAGQDICSIELARSLSRLTHLTVDTDSFTPHNSVPLGANFLRPLYSFTLTHIDFGCFNMCHLDDDALLAVANAMPQIESLILGTSRYWPTPPRASL
ncbi:hypothetical protein BDR03DRAFT_1009488, partial [Suillus americanus]